MKLFKNLIQATLLCIITSQACADILKNEINIKSNFLVIRKLHNNAIFNGSIILAFNNLKLYSSLLTIYYCNLGEKSSIKEIVIPKKLKTIRNDGKEIIVADHAHFYNSTKEFILTGNVKIIKGGIVIHTKKLTCTN